MYAEEEESATHILAQRARVCFALHNKKKHLFPFARLFALVWQDEMYFVFGKPKGERERESKAAKAF